MDLCDTPVCPIRVIEMYSCQCIIVTNWWWSTAIWLHIVHASIEHHLHWCTAYHWRWSIEYHTGTTTGTSSSDTHLVVWFGLAENKAQHANGKATVDGWMDGALLSVSLLALSLHWHIHRQLQTRCQFSRILPTNQPTNCGRSVRAVLASSVWTLTNCLFVVESSLNVSLETRAQAHTKDEAQFHSPVRYLKRARQPLTCQPELLFELLCTIGSGVHLIEWYASRDPKSCPSSSPYSRARNIPLVSCVRE